MTQTIITSSGQAAGAALASEYEWPVGDDPLTANLAATAGAERASATDAESAGDSPVSGSMGRNG